MKKEKGEQEWFVFQKGSMKKLYGGTVRTPVAEEINNKHDAHLIAAAPELLEALRWALPMAIIAMEQHRFERVKAGHTDIVGTYKNGESWLGIYQDEVDKIEFSRAAIAKALGGNQS